MTRSTHVVAPSRAVTLLLVAAFATAGAATLGVQAASATPGDPHQVWVCKYVQKPGVDEVLKRGKNPIHVDAASVTNDRGVAPQLGDAFSDGQFRSVVVSLDAQAPATDCPAADEVGGFGGVSRPGTVTPTTPATTTTPTTPATPTAPATTVPGDPRATSTAVGTGTPTPTGTAATGLGAASPATTLALAPVPAMGDAAPDTGGMGQVAQRSGSGDVLVGVGLLAVAGGLLAARSHRRRRRVVEAD